MKRQAILFSVALLASSAWGWAQAASIHKWIDDKGVTHYSDQLPDTETIQVTQLQIDTGSRSAEKSVSRPENYYSIANQWQRMNREGIQRRQLELQRAAVSAISESRSTPAPVQAEPETNRYIAVYSKRRHHRRGHRQGHQGQGPQQQPPRSSFPSVIN